MTFLQKIVEQSVPPSTRYQVCSARSAYLFFSSFDNRDFMNLKILIKVSRTYGLTTFDETISWSLDLIDLLSTLKWNNIWYYLHIKYDINLISSYWVVINMFVSIIFSDEDKINVTAWNKMCKIIIVSLFAKLMFTIIQYAKSKKWDQIVNLTK